MSAAGDVVYERFREARAPAKIGKAGSTSAVPGALQIDLMIAR